MMRRGQRRPNNELNWVWSELPVHMCVCACSFSPEIPKEGSPLSWVELLKLALHPSSSSRKLRALSTMTLDPAKSDNVFPAQHPSFPIGAPQLGRSDGEEDAQMESG